MVMKTSKIFPREKIPFATRVEGCLPTIDRMVMRESLKGVEKIFNKERYYFSMLEEDSKARDDQRKKLKKLRRIIKDLNMAIRIEL
jgi:cell shape-determining protein MreC